MKRKRSNKYERELSKYETFEDAIEASVKNPVKSSQEIQKAIINTIKETKSIVWTIEVLCKELPEYMREEIVNAMVDMKDVKVLDTESGTIRFPTHYYNRRNQ